MNAPIRLDELTPCDAMKGEDARETAYLKEMLTEAEAYIRSFKWCPKIVERYLGYGVGKVLALFLFRFERPINGSDEWLWVVVGDLPAAYFVVDGSLTAPDALETYCQLMGDWADAVHSGR